MWDLKCIFGTIPQKLGQVVTLSNNSNNNRSSCSSDNDDDNIVVVVVVVVVVIIIIIIIEFEVHITKQCDSLHQFFTAHREYASWPLKTVLSMFVAVDSLNSAFCPVLCCRLLYITVRKNLFSV